MTDIIATAVILVCVGATFCATCYAIARFAYFDRRARADLLLAFYCVVVFAGAVVGCLAFTEAYGNVVSAAFAALLCGCSAAVGALLRKTWAQTDELERRRVEDLRGLVDRYRTEEGSIESRCAHAARTFDLTRREEEVLALLLKGCTRSEIARELFVSGDTVKTHIRNLYRKTGVTGKDELVQAIGGSGLVWGFLALGTSLQNNSYRLIV